MAGRKNSGKTVLGQLKTSQDFNELLSLSKLDIQMEVLGFLQENLFDYQMNYLKSFLKTIDEAIEYIPEKDYHIYFNENETGGLFSNSVKVWEYKNGYSKPPTFNGINSVIEYYKGLPKSPPDAYCPVTGRKSSIGPSFPKDSINESNYFIVNTDERKIHRINKKLMPGMFFRKKKNMLLCVSKYKEMYGYSAPFNKKYQVVSSNELIITICLKSNKFLSIENEETSHESNYIGWGSSAGGAENKIIYEK